MSRVLYVLACVLIPLAWGLVVAAVSRRLEARRPPAPPRDDRATDIDYYI